MSLPIRYELPIRKENDVLRIALRQRTLVRNHHDGHTQFPVFPCTRSTIPDEDGYQHSRWVDPQAEVGGD